MMQCIFSLVGNFGMNRSGTILFMSALRLAWSPQIMDLLGVLVEPQKDNEAVEMLL